MTDSAAAQALDALLAALAQPDDVRLAVLRGTLERGVSARGLLFSGEVDTVDEVISSVAAPGSPAVGLATWGSPAPASDGVTVVGTLPDGLPINELRVSARALADGSIEFVQEVTESPQSPTIGVDISGDIGEFVDTAFDRREPMVLAYVDGDGAPHVSYRGTVQSVSSDQVAIWIRNRSGGFLQAIQQNPRVALIGGDRTRGAHYVLEGRAALVDDDDDLRRVVYESSAEHERSIDAGMRGVAVVVDLDVVKGGPLGATVHQRRIPQNT